MSLRAAACPGVGQGARWFTPRPWRFQEHQRGSSLTLMRACKNAEVNSGGHHFGHDAMNIELVQAVLELPAPAEAGRQDAELVEQCLRGSEQAWSTLIEKYKKLIYSIPVKYGFTREDAADIFQSVSLELISELSRLRVPGALRGWLITVTARKSLRWKRQQQRRGEEELSGTEASPAREEVVPPAVLQELEEEQMVRDAVARLPERCRQMIQLLFYESPPRPYPEVARSLGLATGSVGFIRGRCLQRLQQILEELGF